MVVVFGSINADLIFRVSTLPLPDQTLLASTMSVEPGGKGANQAVAAARDGAPVVLAGAIGRDGLAGTAMAGLAASGVDVSRVVICDSPTGCASICTDEHGRNQIVVAPGANFVAQAAVVEDALLGPGSVLVTQMETDSAQTAGLIRRAHAAGARTIHNLAPAGPLAADVLRLLDVLVVNEDEAAWLARHEIAAGDGAVALRAALGITVVRTLGGKGVEWADSGGNGRIEATHVHPVDTTAAGDCFVGVLAACIYRGSRVSEAVRRANAAAGLACTRRGSQSSLPHSKEIDRLLAGA